MPPARSARAQDLGAMQTLPQLRRLFDRCTSTPVLVGPIHGDLHAKNVRVRATDAIVIDFFSHRNSPLLADAASLEASLLVEGFERDERDPIEWMSSIEALYRNSPLKEATPHGNPKDASSWFYSCVAQIRRYAHQWECQDHQYAGALAAALLRKATRDAYAKERKASRHATAYVFAEWILMAAFGDASVASAQDASPAAPVGAKDLPGANAAAPAAVAPQGPE
jgi:Ser/Thr protein kinase RdoA (MazF antagonist)